MGAVRQRPVFKIRPCPSGCPTECQLGKRPESIRMGMVALAREGPDDVVRASFLAICVRSPVYSLGLPQKKRATVPGPVWQPMVAPMG